MLDLVFLRLKAGDGGDGRVSFFRNRQILKGGPDGGDGGDGGNIVLRGDKTINTLQHFSGEKAFIAADGQAGGQQRKIGKKAQDVVLPVPLGTVVWLLAENQTSWLRRQRRGVAARLKPDEALREKFYLEKEMGAAPSREADQAVAPEKVRFCDFLSQKRDQVDAVYSPLDGQSLIKLAQFTQADEEILLCQGGFGGLGNDAYKSSRNTTPLEAQYGSFGEEKLVFLELQALANIGLVGWPNAGKSTLLSILTKASPKVADYPFTTLEPHLGVMTLPAGKDLVIADIPGLIEGASEGKGLGFDFLRHVENCQTLVFLLSVPLEILGDESLRAAEKAAKLWQQYGQLDEELRAYREVILQKKRLVVLNKIDLYDADLREAIQAEFAGHGVEINHISAATGEGLAELKLKIGFSN